MYCVNCGVRLGDAEEQCPLCGIKVYHPDLPRPRSEPLYPKDRPPEKKSASKGLNGVVIFLFLFPLWICFLSDWRVDSTLNWFGYVAGALMVLYVGLALPLWFRKPNPVVFVPCTFAAVAVYLLAIERMTRGGWFLPFAFPLVGGLCLITTAVVALFRYVRRGRLYILGGASIALGCLLHLTEWLMVLTFDGGFTGWSLYPLVGLALVGGLLIYVAISPSARETIERKLFF